MTEYVALLRGINVGGKAKLPMAQLRETLTAAGFAEVRTLLQSGNVVLRSPRTTVPALQTRLEKVISERFGLTVPCLVRTGAELRDAVDGNPLAAVADDGSKLVVIFLDTEPEPALVAEHDLPALDAGHIVHRGRLLYQWCPAGVSNAPPLTTLVERRWKVRTTARNWNTATKLVAMLTA